MSKTIITFVIPLRSLHTTSSHSKHKTKEKSKDLILVTSVNTLMCVCVGGGINVLHQASI